MRGRPGRGRRRAKSVFIYAMAGLLVLSILAPLFWLVISSLASVKDLVAVPLSWIPRSLGLERYRDIFFGPVGLSFRSALRNSVVVAGLATGVSLVAALVAAYSLSRFPGRGRSSVLYLMLATYMMPPVAILLSLYISLRQLHLVNTVWGLSIVYCSFLVPFLTWILKGFVDTVPRELEEAAMIDGAGRFTTLLRIVVPVAVPGIIAAVLLGILMSWDEFFYALIFTSTDQATTIPVAIAQFTKRHEVDYGMMSAGGVVAALPPVILALVLQRYLIKGLTSGSVKG